MAIQAATAARAKKIGVLLQEQDNEVRGFHQKTGIELFDENPRLLLEDIITAIDIKQNHKSFKWSIIEPDHDKDTDRIYVVEVKKVGKFTDPYLAKAFAKAKAAWLKKMEGREEGDELDDEEDIVETGSVVSTKYRARYSEAGHPTHCGDWLAETLIGMTTNKAGINVEMLDKLAELNGVDLSKYNRTNHGWQGRLRMTFRNIVARKVFLNGGKFIGIDGNERQAPQEWLAAQKFKRPE